MAHKLDEYITRELALVWVSRIRLKSKELSFFLEAPCYFFAIGHEKTTWFLVFKIFLFKNTVYYTLLLLVTIVKKEYDWLLTNQQIESTGTIRCDCISTGERMDYKYSCRI